MNEYKIEYILPEGKVNWKSRGSQSTIDLTFLSKGLEDSVMKCHPAEELESSSDHLPILTELQINPPNERALELKPQWKKSDWNAINIKLKSKLESVVKGNIELNSRQGINQRIKNITRVIQETVEEMIPKASPSTYVKPYWTKECSDVVKLTRRTRRLWNIEGIEESWTIYQKAINDKKRKIKKDKS